MRPLSVRVFIAAHVRLYREGLAEVLGRQDGIEVVGMAGTASETLSVAGELEPDVVLLDPAIPGSMQAVRELAGPARRTTVIALACSEAEPEVIACAEAGVSGFVGLDDTFEDLVATLRSVGKGDLQCSPQMAGALLRRVAELAAERSRDSAEGQLTVRELEVIRLIDSGLSNKQIALRLCIELPTVKHHVHHILEKLGVARRGEAVARLRQRGLLPDHVHWEARGT